MFRNILKTVVNVFNGNSTDISDNDGLIVHSDNEHMKLPSSGAADGLNKDRNEIEETSTAAIAELEEPFKSDLPDTVAVYDSIENVQEYLDNFCIGGGKFGKFKGFCYVINKSWKNCVKFCCDRGGGGDRANHMRKNDQLVHNVRIRQSTTRKTNCSVSISAYRSKGTNETYIWKLRIDEVIIMFAIIICKYFIRTLIVILSTT